MRFYPVAALVLALASTSVSASASAASAAARESTLPTLTRRSLHPTAPSAARAPAPVCVQSADLSCSPNCHSCGGYGCLPQSLTCPTPCDLLQTQLDCQHPRRLNGVVCLWAADTQRCSFGAPDNADPRFVAAVAGVSAHAAIQAQQAASNAMATVSQVSQPVTTTTPTATDATPTADDTLTAAGATTSKTARDQKIIIAVICSVGGLAIVGLAAFFGDRALRRRRARAAGAADALGNVHRRESLLPWLRHATRKLLPGGSVSARGLNNNSGGRGGRVVSISAPFPVQPAEYHSGSSLEVSTAPYRDASGGYLVSAGPMAADGDDDVLRRSGHGYREF